MSKVITFSRNFQKTHPKAGEPTFFVEKIYKSLYLMKSVPPELADTFNFEIMNDESVAPKHHTIRSGWRFKVGDKFSPRVWSGKPYCSKQIIIAPDIEVKKVWNFQCFKDGTFYVEVKNDPNIAYKWIDVTSCELPINDGLSTDDFLAWFPVGKRFEGQIICWNENIEY